MFVDLDFNPDPDQNIIASFYLEAPDVMQGAHSLAAESSVGTWTDITTMKARIKKLGATVFERDKNFIKVAYPLELFEKGNIPLLLSDVAGNVFGLAYLDNLRLLDLEFPREYIESFPGPAHGIAGVREILHTETRPHVGTIIKPKMGLNPEETAEVAYQAFTGGCDFVKDDENLSNQDFCPFTERVTKVLESVDKAEEETGEPKMYAPNVTSPDFLEKAQFVKDQGGKCVMLDIVTAGFTALQMLREMKMVIHGHRAMHAAFTRNVHHGIKMIVIAKIARLSGVDQLHIGAAVGKMEGGKEEIQHIRDAIIEDIGIKSVFPVASGGLHPGVVPQLLEFMGTDVIIQAGGGIHGHPDGTFSGAKAMRQAVDAALNKIPLTEYAKDHEELKKAVDMWGTSYEAGY
jgi:ribulose-bisphosphate carboxylase large chain